MYTFWALLNLCEVLADSIRSSVVEMFMYMFMYCSQLKFVVRRYIVFNKFDSY